MAFCSRFVFFFSGLPVFGAINSTHVEALVPATALIPPPATYEYVYRVVSRRRPIGRDVSIAPRSVARPKTFYRHVVFVGGGGGADVGRGDPRGFGPVLLLSAASGEFLITKKKKTLESRGAVVN